MKQETYAHLRQIIGSCFQIFLYRPLGLMNRRTNKSVPSPDWRDLLHLAALPKTPPLFLSYVFEILSHDLTVAW